MNSINIMAENKTASPNGTKEAPALKPGTEDAQALKPVTKDAPAFEPVTAGGAPLPSIKEFPEKPAPVRILPRTLRCTCRAQLLTHPPLARAQGIPDRTTPSNPRRKDGRKGASAPIVRTKSIAPVGGNNRFGALLGMDGNEGILGGTGKVPRGSTPSTTDSVLAACIYAASFPARRSNRRSPALHLFRARRPTSRRP